VCTYPTPLALHLDVVAQARQHSRKICQHNLCTQCSCRKPDYANASTNVDDPLPCQRLTACRFMSA
jgi:hypothetical protein